MPSKLLFLLIACLLLSGCSTFLYSVGETTSFPAISEAYWTKNGFLIFYAGVLPQYGHTYVFCDRYFAFASLLRSDPKGEIPPYSINVYTPTDLAHCRIYHSETRLSSTSQIASNFGIVDDLVPGSDRLDRYQVNRAAVHLHSPLHRFLIRPVALFLSWFEPSFPYIDVGGRYTRIWDKYMYGDQFEEISSQQVEAFYRKITEEGADN